MVVRRDAASKASPDESHTETAASPQQSAAGPPPSNTDSFPAVLPSTVVNIALHSLLMVTVPFVLFFASHFGALDPLFERTGGRVPSKETKTYLGAGLAVLGVNLVIASFVITAFREQPAPINKKEN